VSVKQIAAAKFKERCLSILDRVGPDGIVITTRGKPVAKLIPIRSESASLIGALEGKVRIKGDIFSTGVGWDAQVHDLADESIGVLMRGW
jgi:prevent-host-death family protein